jgi:hypothetical protein
LQHVSLCPEKVPRKDGLLVVGIDFGTTYSGYAFSFNFEYERNPLSISCKQYILHSLVESKTTTAVLFDKRQQFDSFGFEAECKYAEQLGSEDNDNWYFFRHFKTSLYNKKVILLPYLLMKSTLTWKKTSSSPLIVLTA